MSPPAEEEVAGRKHRPGVLLDLDGTLVDTNYLHTLAWSRALAEAGEWAPMNAIHRLIGMGGDRLVPELLGHESPPATKARPRHYRALIGEARPFPRAAELIRAFHDRGVAVILATSAPADEVDVLVELLGADESIDARTTADDVAASKPSPEVFEKALAAAGASARWSLAVGDSVWDVGAARSAGLGCVGVESGGFSRHELAEAGAVYVYRDVAELLDRLETGPFAALLSRGGCSTPWIEALA